MEGLVKELQAQYSALAGHLSEATVHPETIDKQLRLDGRRPLVSQAHAGRHPGQLCYLHEAGRGNEWYAREGEAQASEVLSTVLAGGYGA